MRLLSAKSQGCNSDSPPCSRVNKDIEKNHLDHTLYLYYYEDIIPRKKEQKSRHTSDKEKG